MLSPREHEDFARITANAFDASITFDEHNGCHCSIRENLIEHCPDCAEDESIVAECEADGHAWGYTWYANSVGSYRWHAGTYEKLVRRVLAEQTAEMQTPWSQRK